ncbi:hypothetical protein G7B40_028460 [Aetokthonos hydrillicola Thurmond2011]|jgi:hypothetical protein|uniref:Uncharacterized protein n=1 Tax=Aetokthonos hydrillicola Thurmond2011 TaxID=2712845 RepID=A0AAP5IBD3_9CYAN|nr:hypothetical protein [Aetokthonos hydrillicola]MBO3458109.1 hypothetical protein [Aetokthonos hydrillicola CCALA 1050]MBW4584330.1 hypothetical protein [Aetokthonos hydrillicola CCALA 1050]MDR9898462.1 hypothetical protein [Aetokthonos hydrillicola Thurmond2011]
MEQTETNDPSFAQQVQKLHQIQVYTRWLVVSLLWLTVGSASLWNLRAEIALLRQYFTWAAVRYGLFYHPVATLGLSFCLGMTTAVLVWQSRNILFGLPQQEKRQLEKQLFRIRQQGPSHPLWKWICH